MQFLRAQVAISNDSGLAVDLAVNTFHFQMTGNGISNLERDDIALALQNFYSHFDQVLSINIGTEARLKMYNLEHAPPRAPIYDDTWVIDSSAVVPTIPNEVAVCLSYRGALGSGVNRRRNQGRIYIGPVDAQVGTDAVGDMRVNSTTRSLLTAAADTWLMPPATPSSLEVIEWCVFSRSNALGLAVGASGPSDEPTYTNAQLVAGFRPITQVWVDDAFDTQRRRGLKPTTRTTVGS